MRKISCAISFFLLAITIGSVFASENREDAKSDLEGSQANEILVSGKLFCSVKRQVILPFNCTIDAVYAGCGQKVKAGEVLAEYRLTPEAALKLRQRVSRFEIKDLELRLAETRKNLANMEDRYKETMQLSSQDMASSSSLAQIERDIEVLEKQKENLQERLSEERSLADEDRAVVEDLLGKTIREGHAPRNGALKAPISSHVIWVHPDLHKDAEFAGGTAVFAIGVMDPMLIRANIHEIEAVQFNVGDLADFTLESIPDREFKARITRISWESITPELDRPSYYEVEFEVPNPDFVLREGLRGRIVFRNAERTGK